MELCVLRFEGSHGAEDALNEVIDAEGVRNPWLLEVGMVARPLLGRVRVGVTFPDGKSTTFHEGDLAEAASDLGAYTGYYVSALAGPFGSMWRSIEASVAGAEMGSEAEQELFHLDEIKKALPRDSSALLLIAEPKLCDVMVNLFKAYDPKVIRRDATEELRKRLEALHSRLAQSLSQVSAESVPATH
jgi:hypothetical protein